MRTVSGQEHSLAPGCWLAESSSTCWSGRQGWSFDSEEDWGTGPTSDQEILADLQMEFMIVRHSVFQTLL